MNTQIENAIEAERKLHEVEYQIDVKLSRNDTRGALAMKGKYDVARMNATRARSKFVAGSVTNGNDLYALVTDYLVGRHVKLVWGRTVSGSRGSFGYSSRGLEITIDDFLADPGAMFSTWCHEIGHAVDYMRGSKLQDPEKEQRANVIKDRLVNFADRYAVKFSRSDRNPVTCALYALMSYPVEEL